MNGHYIFYKFWSIFYLAGMFVATMTMIGKTTQPQKIVWIDPFMMAAWLGMGMFLAYKAGKYEPKR